MIRVLLVDDHVLMREGLKQLFEFADDIQVVGEADNGEEALRILAKGGIDLIVLDVSMPGLHGAELIERIKQDPKAPPILMLSMHNELQIAKRNLKAGALGYVTKNTPPAELMAAVRKVASGNRYVVSAVAQQAVFDLSAVSDNALHELLTPRERDILNLLVKGKKVTEIAQEYGLSVKTVSTHKINIKQKMRISSDAELMRYAIAHGL
jgi:DNA-binding NarL/FixJ family response regulator